MKKHLFLIILLSPLFCSWQVTAQNDFRKEVRVVRAYTPTLSEANKIGILPEAGDTVRVFPGFSYSISPKRFETDYRIDPIKPAKMVGMPIPKLYKTQLTLGAGNYMSPYMDLSLYQLRSKTSRMGVNFSHYSSSGKLKLDNGEKVNSGFSDNTLRLAGARLLKTSVLESEVAGGFHSVHYYGYDTSLDTVPDTEPLFREIYTASAGINYYSSYTDSLHLNYRSSFTYDLVSDEPGNTGHLFKGSLDLNKRFNGQVFGGEIRLRYISHYGTLDTVGYTVLDVNPWYGRNTNEWKFKAGLNFFYDQGTSLLKIFPRADFEFTIVPGILIPYLGITGYGEVNDYGKMLMENTFMVPGTVVRNTTHPLILSAGIKGKYSSDISFNIKASYGIADSMYFFINDTTEYLANRFTVSYDNAEITQISAEIGWKHSEKFRFLLNADYYHYTLDSLEHPWHRPGFTSSLTGSYNLQDKILLSSQLFFTGTRYAPLRHGRITELNPFLDANLMIEYRYTKVLSFFVKFSNLTASRYQVWNQYPAQRFRFMAGFSYSL